MRNWWCRWFWCLTDYAEVVSPPWWTAVLLCAGSVAGSVNGSMQCRIIVLILEQVPTLMQFPS